MNLKKVIGKCALIILSFIAVIGAVFSVTNTNIVKKAKSNSGINKINSSIGSYTVVQPGDENINGTNFVTFDAYFLDNSQKLRGAYLPYTKASNDKGYNVASKELWMELKVLGNGTLKNAYLEFTRDNIDEDFAIISDQYVKDTKIGLNLGRVNFKDVPNGITKLLRIKVLPMFNKYISSNNKVKLVGDHVANDGKIVHIEKEVKFNVDTSVDNSEIYFREDSENTRRQNYYGNTSIREINDNIEIPFPYYLNYGVYKTNNNFLIKGNEKEVVIEGTAEKLNGVYPISINVDHRNDDIIEYNSNTGKFKIIIKNFANLNYLINLNLVYPKSAMNFDQDHLFTLTSTAYNVIENNPNCQNPINSIKETANSIFKYRVQPKVTYEPQVVRIISPTKDNPIYRYEGGNDIEETEKYGVYWIPYLPEENNGNEVVIKQNSSNSDKFEDYPQKSIVINVDNYITNTGVGFCIDPIKLTQDSKIDLYDNDTGNLIHSFNKDEIIKYRVDSISYIGYNSIYSEDKPSGNIYPILPNVKHLKYVINGMNLSDGKLQIYNEKSINDKLLKDNTDRSLFDKLNVISSSCNIQSGSYNRDYEVIGGYNETGRTIVDFKKKDSLYYGQDLVYKNYEVSKNGPSRIYNGKNEIEDLYESNWVVHSKMRGENNLQIISNEKFRRDTQEEDSVTPKFHGIKFEESPSVLLGNDGWIKIFDNDTNELIGVFNSSNWDTYINSPFIYGKDIKNIKVLTSKLNKGVNYVIANIMKIDDMFVKNNINRDVFNGFNNILKNVECSSKIAVDSQSFTGKNNNALSVRYTDEFSRVENSIARAGNKISVSTNKKDHINFYINLETFDGYGDVWSNPNQTNWKSPVILLEFPNEIVDVSDCSIYSEKDKINLLGKEIFEKDGKKFVKLYLDSDEIFNNKNFVFSANVKVNPVENNKDSLIKIYAYNENNDKYISDSKDVNDINNNNNFEEKIGYSVVPLRILAPQELMVNQKVVDYNTNGDFVNAPNIGVIDGNGLGKAKVVLQVKNNFDPSISDVQIVGTIPFKDNKGQLTKNNLGSKVTTMMTGPIKFLSNVGNDVKVYYTENEEINDNWNDSSNNWMLANEVTDWSKIKNFYIDFGNEVINANELKELSYEIKLPQNVEYNSPTFSSVAYKTNLNTKDGKLATSGEGNKVGIQLLKRFNLDIDAKKLGTSYKIPGVIYSANIEGNEESFKTGITNNDGHVELKGLLVDKEYSLKKISTENDYIDNKDIIKFKVSELNGNMFIQFINGEGNIIKSEIIQPTVNDQTKVKFELGYISKYNITLKKVDIANNQPLSNVKYNLLQGDKFIYNGTTREDGLIKFNSLIPGIEYSLKEISADGYYLNDPVKFKVINTDGNPKITILEGNGDDLVINKSESGIDEASVKFKDLKAKQYSIDITKYIKGKNDKLPDVVFKVSSKDFMIDKIAETDENGHLIINGLYEYKSGQSYTGEYLIEEVTPPEGYTRNSGKLRIKGQRNDSGNLEVNVLEDTLTREVDSSGVKVRDINLDKANTDDAVYKIGVEDLPLFTIIKKDAKDGKRLPKTKFAIFQIDDNGVEKTAYDSKGNIVGDKETIDGVDYRVVETDENGEYTKGLKPGQYKFIELSTVDNKYEIPNNIQERTYYVGVGEKLKAKYGWNKVPYSSNVKNVSDDYGYSKSILDSSINTYENYENGDTKYCFASGVSLAGFENVKRSINAVNGKVCLKVGGDVPHHSLEYDCNDYLSNLSTDGRNIVWQANNQIIVSDLETLQEKKKINVTDGSKYVSFGGRILYDKNSGKYLVLDENYNELFKFNADSNDYLKDMAKNYKSIKRGEYDSEYVDGNIDNNIYYYYYYIFFNRKNMLSGYYSNSNIKKISNEYYVQVGVKSGRSASVFLSEGERNDNKDQNSVLYKLDNNGNVLNVYLNSYLVGDKYIAKVEWDCVKLYDLNNNYINNVDVPIYKYNGKASSLKTVRVGENGNVFIDFQKDIDGKSIFPVKLVVAKFGIITPEAEPVSEINVLNNWKKFSITADVPYYGKITSDGQDITDRKIEDVEIYSNSKKNVKIIPNTGYAISKVKVNGEDIPIVLNDDGSMDVSKFENVMENKNITVEFTDNPAYVKVNYLKRGNNEKLANTETLVGKSNDNYTTSPKIIDGYELVKDSDGNFVTPNNAYGQFTSTPIEVNYYYQPKQVDVITSYDLDGTDKKVIPDTTQKVNYGDDYTTTPPSTIPDKYELIETPSNATGKVVSDDPINVHYKYKLKDAKVIVHHYINGTSDKMVDSNNNPIDDKVIDGKVDDQYSTDPADNIPKNYELVSTPVNATGNMTIDPIDVNYYYKLKDATISDGKFEKSSPNIANNPNNKIMYNLSYTANVKNYIGKGVVTIVDNLPYQIDEDKSDINGGEYDSVNKTITWKNVVEINSFDNNGNVEVSKNIGLVYKGVQINEHVNIVNNADANFKLDKFDKNDNQHSNSTTDGQFARKIVVNNSWDDNNNQNHKRPNSIKYVLKNGDDVVRSQVVTGDPNSDNNWNYNFDDVPKYDDNNQLINYTIDEESVNIDDLKFYKKTITGDMNNGFNIVNKFKIPGDTINIKVDKKWDDNSNRANKRPSSILIRLKNSADIVKEKTLNGNGDQWSYTFNDVPKFNQFGDVVNYSVEELETNTGDLKFYNRDITGDNDNGFVITNTFTVPDDKIDISVNKHWDDNNNQNHKRPQSIKFVLNGGENPVEQIVTGDSNSDNNWSYTFSNLKKYDGNGNVINYNVDEHEVNHDDFKFYSDKIVGDFTTGYNVTNKFVSPEDKIKISVNTVWDDSDNKNGKRPDSVKVVLNGNGSEVKSKVISGDPNKNDNWNHIFDNLPKYDDNGNEINYSVIEKPINNDDLKFYTTNVSGDKNSGFVINNKFTVPNETVKPHVTIDWDDNNNGKKKRPDAVKVVIKDPNGNIVKEGDLGGDPSDNIWTKDFDDLPKYNGNGKEIPYTVEVLPKNPGDPNDPNNPGDLDFYIPSTKGDIGKGFTVTETLTVPDKKVSVDSKVKWDDDNNSKGKRPDSVRVVVKNGDKVVSDKVISGDPKNDNGWNYKFNNLPKYNSNGDEINYTIDEEPVKPDDLLYYNKSVDGDTITNKMRLTGDGDISDSKVSKSSDVEKITDANQQVPYKISYTGKVNNYIGRVKVTLVDRLPFEIDESKSDIANGVYDSVARTITWVDNITGVDTYNQGSKVINIEKNITLVYKGLVADKQLGVLNSVDGNIELTDTNKKVVEKGDKSIPTDLKSKVIVKYVLTGGNGDNGGKVADDKVIEGHVGDDYKTTPPENIGDDYELIKVDGDEEGKITQDPKTISYIYKKKTGKIIVTYIDKDTGKKLYDDDVIEGKIGDKANIKPKDAPYYNLVDEPKDVVITDKDQVIAYSYKKKIFNMEVYKSIKDGSIDGEHKSCRDGKFTKLDVPVKKVNNGKVKIRYSVKVKNTGEIKGSAVVVERIPEFFEMLPEENPDWEIANGKILSKEVTLEPTEEKELIITLTWKNGRSNFGTLDNVAEIDKTKNDAGFDETDSDAEKSGKNQKATLVLAPKTGNEEDKDYSKLILGISVALGISFAMVLGLIARNKIKEDKKFNL